MLEDWNQALTSESFNAINACLSGDINQCTLFPTVKAVRVESLDTDKCSTQIFKLVHCCFPNLTLIHVKVEKDIVPFITRSMNLLSRRGIHTEITISTDKCTVESAVYLLKSLELLQGIEGLHIVSYCTDHDVKNEVVITHPDNHIHLSMLPQYHTLTLEGNIVFTARFLVGQRSLRHLHLKGVIIDEFSELIQIIEANPDLETLQIVNATLSLKDDWGKLSQLTLPSTLVALNLDGNNLKDTFVVDVLSTHLKQFQHLQHLSLNDNKITDVGIRVLINTISNSMTYTNLHFLDLSNNPISIRLVSNLGQIISNLRYLAFKRCQILYDDIHLISQLFEDIPTLQVLHLCKSSYSNDNKELVSRSLPKTTQLTHDVLRVGVTTKLSTDESKYISPCCQSISQKMTMMGVAMMKVNMVASIGSLWGANVGASLAWHNFLLNDNYYNIVHSRKNQPIAKVGSMLMKSVCRSPYIH